MIYTQTSAHTHTHTCPKSEPELGCRTLGSTPPGKPRSRMLSSFKLSKSSKSNWSSDQLTPRRPKRSEEIASCQVSTPGWLGAVCKEMKPVQVRVSRAHPEERRHHHHCLSLLISNSPTLNQWHIDLSTPNKSACNQKLAVIKKCWKMFNTADNMGRTCFKIKTRYRKLLLQHVFFHAIESQKVQRCVLRKTHTHSHKVEGYNDTMPMKLQLMEKLLEYHAIQQANWQPSHERYIQAQFATCQSCWSLWIGVMSPCSVPKIWEPVKCFKKVYLFTPAYVQYIFPTLSRFNFIGNRRPEVILTYSDLMNPLSWNKLSSFWWLPNSPSITSLSVWRH